MKHVPWDGLSDEIAKTRVMSQLRWNKGYHDFLESEKEAQRLRKVPEVTCSCQS
jgi:hypothetical protein